jgi:quinol monooxygenase YgiN
MGSNLFVFTRICAKEGLQQSVAAAIEEVLGPTSQELGCITIDAFRSTGDPRLFCIHSRWQDEADFDDHLQRSHTLQFLESIRALSAEPMKVTRAQLLLRPVPVSDIASYWI